MLTLNLVPLNVEELQPYALRKKLNYRNQAILCDTSDSQVSTCFNTAFHFLRESVEAQKLTCYAPSGMYKHKQLKYQNSSWYKMAARKTSEARTYAMTGNVKIQCFSTDVENFCSLQCVSKIARDYQCVCQATYVVFYHSF